MPRELCDLIYSYLLGENIHLEASKATEEELGLHKMIPALDSLLGQHFTQIVFVGDQFHQALVTQFYETAVLRIVDFRSMRGHQILHGNDPFGSEIMFASRLRNVVFIIRNPLRWDISKVYVSMGLEALANFAGRGCKVTVQVEEETNITLTRILAFIGPKLRIAQEAGLKVEVRRGKDVVKWEEVDWCYEGMTSEDYNIDDCF